MDPPSEPEPCSMRKPSRGDGSKNSASFIAERDARFGHVTSGRTRRLVSLRRGETDHRHEHARVVPVLGSHPLIRWCERRRSHAPDRIATLHERQTTHRPQVARRFSDLTRHKISCREPAVHATQHTLSTADTPSVNGRLARGQLHRLVRPWRVRSACEQIAETEAQQSGYAVQRRECTRRRRADT